MCMAQLMDIILSFFQACCKSRRLDALMRKSPPCQCRVLTKVDALH